MLKSMINKKKITEIIKILKIGLVKKTRKEPIQYSTHSKWLCSIIQRLDGSY